MIQIRHVDELLQRHDREFVVASYNALLGRDPDEEGLAFYLARLRAGLDRTQMLLELSRSDEARLFAARIDGLPALLDRVNADQRRLLRSLRRDNGPQLNRIENLLARVHHEMHALMPARLAGSGAPEAAGEVTPRRPLASDTLSPTPAARVDGISQLPWPQAGSAALVRRMARPTPAPADLERDGCDC